MRSWWAEPRHAPMVTVRQPFAPNGGCGARGAVPYVQTTTSLCRLAPTSGALPPVYGPDAPEHVGPDRASGPHYSYLAQERARPPDV